MTNQPLRGNYPPSAASSRAALPREAYTAWTTRAVATLIDLVPVLVVMGIGIGLLSGTREHVCAAETTEYDVAPFCSTGSSTLGLAAFGIAVLLSVVYVIWNHGYRQGTTGASIGKAVLKIQIVSERTGQPLGFARSFLRQLVHALDAAVCWVGYLFPLWDRKRQTFADMIMNSVCISA